jgi:soluble lytic murein transglycosylase-like protein
MKMAQGSDDKRALGVLALAGVGLYAFAQASRHSNLPGGGAVTQCGYPGDLPAPYPKSRDELFARLVAHINQANPGLRNRICDARFSCAEVVAGGLTAADQYGLPLDLMAAVTWRESTFNTHTSDLDKKIRDNAPIGPMQVRPIAFRDVGINPETLLAPNMLIANKVQLSISAGLAYFRKLRTHYLPGANWCDLLHAYNVGPTAFKNGRRNQGYVAAVVTRTIQYSDLRT